MAWRIFYYEKKIHLFYINTVHGRKSGYTFAGWVDTEGHKVDLSTATFNEDTTLTATWTLIPPVIDDDEDDNIDDTPYIPTAPEESSESDDSMDPEEIIVPDKIDVLGNYKDIEQDAWYADAAYFAVANDLMIGTGDDKWAPKKITSRAEFIKIMYNMSKASLADAMEVKFEDVDSDSWYAEAVIWATSNGIVNGLSDNLFAPEAPIIREQLITILFRFDASNTTSNHELLSSFNDTDKASSWALDSLAWAVEMGILPGDDLGNLNPTKEITRAEVAIILMRYLTLKK